MAARPESALPNPARFDIGLPADKDVFVETGIYDWQTGKYGTLEITPPIDSARMK